MTLEEEFKDIVEHSLYELFDKIIIPYLVNCYHSLSNFVSEKTNKPVNFTYDNSDKILQGFYKIGVENCKKEYDYYNSILSFQKQAVIDHQLMKQIRFCYFLTDFNENKFKQFNNTISYQVYNHQNRKKILDFDKEFYIKKYKFYNSFKITLS
jgi:hypothetical protein